MHRHRFLQEDTGPLPGAAAAVLSASGFVACPLVPQQGWVGPLAWQQVYQWAFAQAVAVARPSPLERLAVSLN